VHNPRPGHEPAKAIIANRDIPEKIRIRADKTVVPQCLHNRHTLLIGGVINGWGPQREKILDVENVKTRGAQLFLDLTERFVRPNCAQRHPHCAEFLNAVVVLFQQLDFVTVSTEQSRFLLGGTIFSTGEKIAVVEHENPHRLMSPHFGRLCNLGFAGF
jgi:hypothetical protein